MEKQSPLKKQTNIFLDLYCSTTGQRATFKAGSMYRCEPPWARILCRLFTLDRYNGTLAPYKAKAPVQDVPVLPYLRYEGDGNYDVELEIELQPEGGQASRISRTNFKYLYWNVCQQLAHHTVNGCNVCVGDIMASGTISGPDRDNAGCLLEQTRNGQEPVTIMAPPGNFLRMVIQ